MRNSPWGIQRATLAFLLILIPLHLQAADFWGLQKADCSMDWGVVISVDDNDVNILTLDGRFSVIKRSDVHRLSRYRSNEIPARRYLPSGADTYLKQVDLESGVSFAGYAYEFSGEAVLFLDDRARTRVVQLQDIRSIKTAIQPADVSWQNRSSTRLINPTDGICPGNFFGNISLPMQAPVQIYDSYHKIDSQLASLESGYRTLDGLKERIDFYPKPILFDQRTRIGFFFNIGDTTDVPIKAGYSNVYLETGSGDSYKFQSHFLLGTQRYRSLPFTDTTFGFDSQFKSHLIHGSLTGNLNGLRAGDHIFQIKWNDEGKKHPWLAQSFNHETLLGVDLWGWFVDTGYYFPAFTFGNGNDFREMTADNPSQIVSVGRQNKNLKLQALVFDTSSKAQNNPMKGSYLNKNNSEATDSINNKAEFEIPTSIRITAKQARLNFTYTTNESLTLGASLLQSEIKVSELAQKVVSGTSGYGDDALGEVFKNNWTYRLSSATANLHYDIGQYIGLTSEILYSKGELVLAGPTQKTKEKIDRMNYTVGLEFIL